MSEDILDYSSPSTLAASYRTIAKNRREQAKAAESDEDRDLLLGLAANADAAADAIDQAKAP